MKNFDEYMTQWELRDASLIEKTKMCEVYKVYTPDGEERALKVMNEIGVRFEADSYQWFEYMNGHGAVLMHAHDENAILLEYMDGGELAELVFAGKDEEASDIAMRVIKELHDGQDAHNAPSFKSLEEHFACLFKTEFDHELMKSGQKLARKLLDSQTDEDTRVLHADIHHKNILKGARGWLAIDPQKAVGDRHYEPANLFKNPEGFDGALDEARMDMLEQKAAEILRLDPYRVREFAFAHMMLSVTWSILDKEDPSLALSVAEMLYKRLKS